MDIALALPGSLKQIALFVARSWSSPVLLGPDGPGLPAGTVAVGSGALHRLDRLDGETHWLEGAFLLAVYACSASASGRGVAVADLALAASWPSGKHLRGGARLSGAASAVSPMLLVAVRMALASALLLAGSRRARAALQPRGVADGLLCAALLGGGFLLQIEGSTAPGFAERLPHRAPGGVRPLLELLFFRKRPRARGGGHRPRLHRDGAPVRRRRRGSGPAARRRADGRLRGGLRGPHHRARAAWRAATRCCAASRSSCRHVCNGSRSGRSSSGSISPPIRARSRRFSTCPFSPRCSPSACRPGRRGSCRRSGWRALRARAGLRGAVGRLLIGERLSRLELWGGALIVLGWRWENGHALLAGSEGRPLKWLGRSVLQEAGGPH